MSVKKETYRKTNLTARCPYCGRVIRIKIALITSEDESEGKEKVEV
jgi:hypothetical protein